MSLLTPAPHMIGSTFLFTGSREGVTRGMVERAWVLVERVKQVGGNIIVGDAPGMDDTILKIADRMDIPTYCCSLAGAERFADRGIDQMPKTHPISFDFKSGSWLARDRAMAFLLGRADWCVAVWNGTSNGTRYTFECAEKWGSAVVVYGADGLPVKTVPPPQMLPCVVNVRDTPCDVYIGRGFNFHGYRIGGTPFGNPFVLGREEDRAAVLDQYRTWFYAPVQAQLRLSMGLQLRGKVLGCHCKQRGKEVACHGDVILEFLNSL